MNRVAEFIQMPTSFMIVVFFIIKNNIYERREMDMRLLLLQ